MIDALKKGSAAAFKEAYTLYSDKVYCYFKKKTRSEEDAHDLVQTTFLKLWQYRLSLSSEYLFDQHLFHIAKTVFIDYLRKQNKSVASKKEMALRSETISQSNPFLSYSINSQVSAVLSSMPEVRRKVFELNRLQGYSYKEVAELLSISVKAVDNNLTQALKELRKQISISMFLIIYCSHFFYFL